MLARVGALIRLLRWLGPWTAETRVPASVDFKDIDVRRTPDGLAVFDCFGPPSPFVVRYMSCGVHHLGASDPRMSRLFRFGGVNQARRSFQI